MIIVVIATVGRPRNVEDCLRLLAAQSRRPDLVLVSATSDGDLPEPGGAVLARLPYDARLVIGPKGLTRQRNRALDVLERSCPGYDGFVAFFDDDFVPREDWLENAAAEFAARPACVGLTGVLVADGASGPGYDLAQAADMLGCGRGMLRRSDERARCGPARALYGCNMALRGAALRSVRFDEALPLYGWLEDEDVSGQLRKLGELFRSDGLVGVHLGTKSGRVPSANYGYSQIANPIYLVRKGTYPASSAARLMARNLAANLLKTPFPEPYVDRASRLRGNMRALADLARGRLHPGGAAELR
ncbi:glycosyltransferase family 2 protein [Phenylobacterium sp.]|uniref:glycosyltransferase family 2 protein n=1 Tax=Phenylobacterium sp. TaxID=1871053 RepID=UPI002BF27DE0|nr:glycosyltransferase [Phenylobacterium sp.]HVI30561.1 glycosyltransferase [Phenylobacterium sp.]